MQGNGKSGRCEEAEGNPVSIGGKGVDSRILVNVDSREEGENAAAGRGGHHAGVDNTVSPRRCGYNLSGSH